MREKLAQISKIIREKLEKNRLTFFIAGSLAVALVLIGAGMVLYKISGTAQLDLSRPSYQEAREQAKRQREEEKRRKDVEEDWRLEGDLNKKKLAEFERYFNEKVKKIDGVGFEESALNDETLNLTDEIKQESEQ